MIEGWIVLVVATSYLLILFAVANYGDRIFARQPEQQQKSRPNIYAFSLAIFCTTWTFFGSVGLASTSGLNFLAIYIGPMLVMTIGFPLIKRIIRLSKEERITSVADFLGSRYGKNLNVAAVAALIAVVGTVPYIALQLKAISSSVSTLIFVAETSLPERMPFFGDISILIALTLALFAILFGTRHADATEHQHGLMLAIAMESAVKLAAFLSVGVFVTFFMFDGVFDLFSQALQIEKVQTLKQDGLDYGGFFILTLVSLLVFLLLPRQFHVAVVENNSIDELRRARWLFPLYLIAINLFVIPIALAGTILLPESANADDYVLLLPILANEGFLSLLVFIGGLSAGTAMVVVASVALAIMISNDLVLPLLLRVRALFGHSEPDNMEDRILNVRRTSILFILLFAYAYYKVADNSAALASIGLVSFAAIAQLAPAFFGGLVWKRATAKGAMLGMITGFIVWAYCLFIPTILPVENEIIREGLFGWSFLKPQALFGTQFSPYTNGVIWSLTFNTFAFVIGSLIQAPGPVERMQASLFVSFQAPVPRSPWVSKSALTNAQLMNSTSRFIGRKRTRRAFDAYWADKGLSPDLSDNIDNDLLRHSEQLLASAIGASSSRLVHSLLLKRYDKTDKSNLKLLNQASKALQYNHDVLQTALDQIEQGITVFDHNFRLASWNTQFRRILGISSEFGQAGTPLSEIAKEITRIHKLDQTDPGGENLSERLVSCGKPWLLTLAEQDEVLEIRTNPMPEGGVVVTWNNITERVRSADALHEANETLEKRVEERTLELEIAKKSADKANISKTRYLAAAGHDILQPLNAARLYSSTLQERVKDEQDFKLTDNIVRSLGSVEEILGAILAISRLDATSPEVVFRDFPLRTITEQLQVEFDPIAKEHGLELKFIHTNQWVHSDRALLRRLLQNLISNALKFTESGKVLVGCRRLGDSIALDVHDTGIGMDQAEQEKAFAEFTRLDARTGKTTGLGLGLSIVERISKLLEHEVIVRSEPGHGSHFRTIVPKAMQKPISRRSSQKATFAAQSSLDGMKVLCIDNDISILEGMKGLLNQWGCEVMVATGSQGALRAVGKGAFIPDMVLVDYHLDNETGEKAIEALQKKMKVKVPGILISADRSDQVATIARSSELTLLNKPVKPASLRAAMVQHKTAREAAE